MGYIYHIQWCTCFLEGVNTPLSKDTSGTVHELSSARMSLFCASKGKYRACTKIFHGQAQVVNGNLYSELFHIYCHTLFSYSSVVQTAYIIILDIMVKLKVCELHPG